MLRYSFKKFPIKDDPVEESDDKDINTSKPASINIKVVKPMIIQPDLQSWVAVSTERRGEIFINPKEALANTQLVSS